MGESKVATLLLWIFFTSCSAAKVVSLSEIEIEAELKRLNKPAVKTIKSEDGDIIDCVDIYKQPAFDHPALKNHTIRTVPDFLLKSQNSKTIKSSDSEPEVFQTWQKSGSCPEGTVPIRRILKEDLLRASSLQRFGRKPPAVFKNATKPFNLNFINPNESKIYVPENRSAAYLVTMGYNYIGAEGDINVWNPHVQLSDDFTTAQIWLKTGNGGDFESVESGWTKDSYKTTGCFDLVCSGFVQTASTAVLGASIEPISSRYGQQYDFNFGIFWDDSGNWWLKIKHDVPVGYWPAELLGNLRHSATLVEWGGQVFSEQVKKSPHTQTSMGSGEFANGLWGDACFINNVRIKDYSLQLKYPEFVSTHADEPYCYNSLNYMKTYGQEPVFYFGGPGQRPPYCS
ncbi:hypothetical protein Fmac_000524 [Flemingia macrophylla]|uniref:Neprosin PEP catalytic domain-containing protein n=1 Tax=Flemingia macrophylla TaxID=520843 RepID=A0ABD1NEI6_9FABA